ncbi:MAG: methylenetetrahydrofolate reductase [Actinobacteria bacterium]|nr:methylenetetrahydrofolate reductase [Actinomycetota bacterium]MBW3650816.1 methylenetetrahydrofolate reductase [Actinomycetota bacterium]
MAPIADLLAAGPTFSFEFFPPKNDAEQAALVRTLRELEPLEPSFVSVTYRGGRSSRDRTLGLVSGMLKATSLNPMAHLICVAHTRLELAEILVELRKAGIDNLMALGGDPPTDPEAGPGELVHALELVELARAIGGFSIGVAAHPIGHPRSPDLPTDRRHLAEKLRLADFAITQFFFEVEDYLRLVDDMEPTGVTKPIIPGIMPIRSLQSVPRMAQMGAAVPGWMVARLEAAGSVEAEARVGIECATELCEKLLAEGAPGLHFYTLNTSTATREIYRSLGLGPAPGAVTGRR